MEGDDQANETVKVMVHPLSQKPDDCWNAQKDSQTHEVVNHLSYSSPKPANCTRFVCISDTHGLTDSLEIGNFPDGDVLLYCGDFSLLGHPDDIEKFSEFLRKLNEAKKYKETVIIAGNHELGLDINLSEGNWNFKRGLARTYFGFSTLRWPWKFMSMEQLSTPDSFLNSYIYLEDKMVNVLGFNIYGSPWQPEFFNLAFNLPRGEKLLEKWNMIPEDVDILLTHGPPLGHGDLVKGKYHVGCAELLSTVQQRVKPKVHVFGHIHEGYGVTTDGVTTFINASTCTYDMKPINPPIIFDLETPE